MGIFSTLKGSDEAAKASDETVDESMDEAYARRDGSGSGNDDFVDQNVNQRGSIASAYGSLTNVAKRGVRGAGSEVGSYGTRLALIGGGAYTAGQVIDMQKAKQQAQSAESKKKAYQQMLQRIKDIRDNDNLSKEEKEQAIARVREMYSETWGINKNGGGGGSGGPFSSLLSMVGLGGGGANGSLFSGLAGKFVLAFFGISALWVLPSLIEAVRGRGGGS